MSDTESQIFRIHRIHGEHSEKGPSPIVVGHESQNEIAHAKHDEK